MGFVPGTRAHGRAALFFCAMAAFTLVGGCVSPKPVATVNNTSLSEKEFASLCETASQVDPRGGSVGSQVLVQWIQSTLQAQQARKYNAYPSDTELKARVETFRKRAESSGGSFEDQLRQRGMTLEAFKREVLNSLIFESVAYHGVEVSDADIAKMYEKVKPQAAATAQAHISQITVDKKATMEQVKSELANPSTNFGLVAQTRSMDPFASGNGKVPFPVSARMQPGSPVAPEVVQAAMKLKEGQVSGPIKVGAVWVFVKLDQKMGVPALEELRPFIRAQLLQEEAQKSGKAQQNQQAMAEELRKASIKVNRPEYQPVVTMIQQQASAPRGGMPGGSAPAGGASGPRGGAPIPGSKTAPAGEELPPPPPPGK